MIKTTSNKRRPVYLNLFKIRLPVAGMVSLAHRASGILMFLAMPFVVYLLDLSVRSTQGFDQAVTIVKHPLVMTVGMMFVWALAHHLFAGIRFLLIDADIGVEKKSSTVGAWLVIALAVLSTVILIMWVLV
ncbi:MAG: succinate dehydrogenase, cytochrome b556 subunit [Gammaproteobacteria bacterium]|nr:succinate dehydrogenase, cytochrome b556 subunit [Gammaproteobacteria bacterium]